MTVTELQKDDLGNIIDVLLPWTSADVADWAQSSALDGTVVRVAAKADVTVEIGTNPTAAATGCYLPEGNVEYFKITRNDKISPTWGIINVTVMG